MKKIFAALFAIMLIFFSATMLAEDWLCEKCNNSATGNFCSNCGSAKPTSPSAGNLAEQPSSDGTIVLDDAGKYAKAIEYQNTENYMQAIDLFAAILEYSDADLHLMECVEQQAARYYENEEYSVAQALLLQYPSEKTAELLAQCNDHCFLIDLQNALCARWARTNTDVSLMSDKKLREYYASLVSDEMKFIDKYNNLAFSDSTLAGYAYCYISALQNQWIAANECSDTEQDEFDELWTTRGTLKREQMVYLINRKYGLDLPSEYLETFRSFVVEGQLIDTRYAFEEMLIKQLYALQYSIKTNKYGSPEFIPISIKNTTNYSIYYCSIQMNFLNIEGEMVANTYLLSDFNIKKRSNIGSADAYISSDIEFDSISFSYEFYVNNGYYQHEKISGTVVPRVQYSFKNGILNKNGTLVEGQPVFEITDLTAQWEVHQFTSKKLYVPTLKFSVKNTGNASADKVTVRCTIINQDTHEIWSEETKYLVGFSDSALMPNYSKKAAVYSSIGYNSKIIDVPNLIAEIYVNDILVRAVSINP